MSDFDFYTFLKDISNDNIVPLQNNSRYDTVISAMSNEFSKIYKRYKEIKIGSVLSETADPTFQKNLDNNLKVVDDTETIYTDVLLNYISQYLDTDHFKDTVSLMIKKWQEREPSGIEDIEVFVRDNIIPYFKFFTLNSGDLHKAKGTRPLLGNLFNFYGDATANERSFDEILEYDTADDTSSRMSLFTSPRVVVNENSIRTNYTTTDDMTITKYLETANLKIAMCGDKVFLSKKSREDWWFATTADDVLKLNENY